MTALALSAPAGADPAQFREAMSRLAATVHVVTTEHAGRRYGMTITAACSLSAEPMSVVVCINRQAAAHDAIVGSGRLCLNMLAADQADLAACFAGAGGMRGEDRFAHAGSWSCAGEPPVMLDAIAALECRVALATPFGTHTIFACHVDSIRLGDRAGPLLYAHRRYAALADGAGDPLPS